MKQVGPGSETVPPSASTLILGERGQPASEVGLVVSVIEVSSSVYIVFWLRGNEMTMLGCRAIRSRGPP